MPTKRMLKLRERALHRDVQPSFHQAIIEAEAWRAGGNDEPWLIWRAQRTAALLERLPIEIESEELLVGRISMQSATAQEIQRLEEARQTLKELPPWPGGDTGHFSADHPKLLRLGVGGLIREIEGYQARLDKKSAKDRETETFYEACTLALSGLSRFIERHAEGVEAHAMTETDPARKAELRGIAAACRHVSQGPARTFHEAIQLMHFAILALHAGEDHVLNVAGRMDRTLYPYYQADLETGRITPETAQELIDCFYILINEYTWRGLAISVMVGGRDAAGRDVTNAVSFMCLHALEEVRLVYPTVGICWHRGTPEALMHLGCQVIAQGLGSPAIFNDEVIARGLREYGVSEEDSVSYINSTCVEITPIANSNVWVASPYYNCPGALLEVLEHADSDSPETFEGLVEALEAKLSAQVREAVCGIDRTWRGREIWGGMPLQSALTDDCLARGKDIDSGGARYNWVECSFVGLANLVDSLVVLRQLVFEQKRFSLPEFYRILQNNFDGHESLRQEIVNRMPKYGNDDDRADRLAVEMTKAFSDICASQRIGSGKHRYAPGLFCWVMHEQLGRETGATPDGRFAGFPLADGAGPAQGRERHGPTGAIKSTTKWPHEPMLGGLVLNLKFSPSALDGEESMAKLRYLIESYMRLGGFEVQINVVDRQTLLDAQMHPEAFQDLLVRVAGYSDYFVHLSSNMQTEVIARTEYGAL
ncbi:MAG: pyruvate formate lyase family protein [Candidatus Latescibacterota bacterium]